MSDLAALVTRAATATLQRPPGPQAPNDASGLKIERAGVGQDGEQETIDVFVSTAGPRDAKYLGELAYFLQHLPPDVWARVRVLDSQGRAVLHRGGAE